LFSYMFLLNLGALVLGRLRKWPGVEAVALAATVVLYAGWWITWFGAANRTVASVFALVFYAQFSVSNLPALWATVQILAPLAMPGALEQAGFAWHLIFVAGGLAVSEIRRRKFAPLWTLAGFLFPVWLWLADGQNLGNPNPAAAVL